MSEMIMSEMAAILLAHGAGSNRDAKVLMEVEAQFTAHGVVVRRYDLPFRQLRPKGPPRPADAAGDRAGLRDELVKLRREHAVVWVGGHSYGGRQASMLCAEEPGIADALLLLGYPLHPPMKRLELRTGHFPALRTRAAFVSGTRDPFGLPAELLAAVALIPGRTEVRFVEGAGHDLTGKLTEVGIFKMLASI